MLLHFILLIFYNQGITLVSYLSPDSNGNIFVAIILALWTPNLPLAIPNLEIDIASSYDMCTGWDINSYESSVINSYVNSAYGVGTGIGPGVYPEGNPGGGLENNTNAEGFREEYPGQGPRDFVSSHPNKGVNIGNQIVSSGWSHDKDSNLYMVDESDIAQESGIIDGSLSPRTLGFHATNQAGLSHQPYASNLANAMDHATTRFINASRISQPYFHQKDWNYFREAYLHANSGKATETVRNSIAIREYLRNLR